MLPHTTRLKRNHPPGPSGEGWRRGEWPTPAAVGRWKLDPGLKAPPPPRFQSLLVKRTTVLFQLEPGLLLSEPCSGTTQRPRSAGVGAKWSDGIQLGWLGIPKADIAAADNLRETRAARRLQRVGVAWQPGLADCAVQCSPRHHMGEMSY